MRQIDYKTYLDKVYGCWIGKCVAGTIGAPYEGAKELFDFEYDPKLIEKMLPNDDLDLQVLWLSVLEEKGIAFTSDDLADAFLNRCKYAPGEYAFFKKNYARGIHPPLSGAYNNRYYIEGMGCPIRSEVWACIAPGNPQLAAELAAKDGVLDHAGNSVYAEQFLAALEAAAFFESDIGKLVEIGLSVIPEDSKIAGLIRDVRDWCQLVGDDSGATVGACLVPPVTVDQAAQGTPLQSPVTVDQAAQGTPLQSPAVSEDTGAPDWRYVRSQILRKYGHPDCTNMYQNMGITLLALFLGRDFLDTTMMALNCGFDTDCTCATAGSVLGIIQGAEYLSTTHEFPEQRFKLGVDAPRRSDRVLDLAEDTCLMGLHFAEYLNRDVAIIDAPKPPQIERPEYETVKVSIDYQGVPAMGIGETRKIKILFDNERVSPVGIAVSLTVPDGWDVSPTSADLLLDPGVNSWEIEVTVPADIPVLDERNMFELGFDSSAERPETPPQPSPQRRGNRTLCPLSVAGRAGEGFPARYPFGIVGASVWEVFGPFWQNIGLISEGTKDEMADVGRIYHLNTRVDPDREYMTLDEILGPKITGDAAKEGQVVCFGEDLMSMSDAVGFQGPCAVYMVRRMISPEDRTLGVLVGHTDAYKLWINGELISRRDDVDWWTAENAHIHGVKINKGENMIVLQMIRRSSEAKLSILFVKRGSCSEHYYDFASVNPRLRE